jgi:DNA polymerase I
MEQAGIRIETAQLASLSERMDAAIARLTEEIHALAGQPFNINSPQQLGKILFEDLGLPAHGRTGKGKSYSTAADVLEALSPRHPIAAKVLEYRQLTKLKGTYVDALPQLIDPRNHRLHTTFHPAGAATGRLSSSNPNLQNIPVRTELGREIRAAFVPAPGWTLLVADYSQIELRLLAHISGDPVLVDAFRTTRTSTPAPPPRSSASRPWSPPRCAAAPRPSTSASSTARPRSASPPQLGVPKHEAEKLHPGYFERYAGVKHWIDIDHRRGPRKGYPHALRPPPPHPDITRRNPNARSFAERTAVNTPLQGTAADLIKLAMIRIHKLLREQKLASRMILQVHDELVFEAPPDEAQTLARLVKHEMESVRQFAVPLVVDTGVGDNWRDAK